MIRIPSLVAGRRHSRFIRKAQEQPNYQKNYLHKSLRIKTRRWRENLHHGRREVSRVLDHLSQSRRSGRRWRQECVKAVRIKNIHDVVVRVDCVIRKHYVIFANESDDLRIIIYSNNIL